jgi:hypothetical protein
VKEYLVHVDNICNEEKDRAGPAMGSLSTMEQGRSRLAELFENYKIMVPIAPLVDNRTIMVNDTEVLLNEHIRSIDEVLERLLQDHGSRRGRKNNETTIEDLIGFNETATAMLCHHLMDLSQG